MVSALMRRSAVTALLAAVATIASPLVGAAFAAAAPLGAPTASGPASPDKETRPAATFTYAQPMDPATSTISIVDTTAGGAAVPCSVSFEASNDKIDCTVTADLVDNHSYTATANVFNADDTDHRASDTVTWTTDIPSKIKQSPANSSINASVTSKKLVWIGGLYKITAALTIPQGCPGIYLAPGGALYKTYDYVADYAANALLRNADYTTKLTGFCLIGPGKIINPNPTTYPGMVLSFYGDGLLFDDFTVDGLGDGGLCRLAGDGIRVGKIRAINPLALAGVPGVRFVAGKNFRCVGAHVDAGDATFQLVPIDPASTTAMPTNGTITDAVYIGCTGSSQVANLLQVSLNGTSTGGVPIMSCSITQSGFIGCVGDGGSDGAIKTQNRDSSGQIDVFFTDCQVGPGTGSGGFRVDIQDAFGGIGAVTVRAKGIKAASVAVTGNATNHIAYAHIDGEFTNPAPTVTFCDDFSLNGSQPINAQTGTTYTLALADAKKLVTLSNAASVTVTVPANATAGFAIGTEIDLAQLGLGPVRVNGAGGVVITAPQGLYTRVVGSKAKLVKTGTDTWLLSGDLTSSPTYRSVDTASSQIANTVTSVAANIPAGTAVGDVLLAVVGIQNITDTIATPTGWTLQAGPIDTSGGSDTRGYLFSRVADGTEGATVTFTRTGTSAGGWRVLVTAWQNTSGVGVVASNSAGATATNAPVIPTVTPTLDLSTEVGAIITPASIATTAPSIFQKAVDSRDLAANSNPNIELCYRALTSTAATGTANGAISSAKKWVTFAVTLKHV